MTAKRKRAGRTRKLCRRQPNGQPSRAGDGNRSEIVAESVEGQRARMLGVVMQTREDMSKMMDQRLGSALGILAARPLCLDERDYRAGEQLAWLWRRWAAAHGIPPRAPLRSDGTPGRDVGEQERAALDRRMAEVRARVWRLKAGVVAWRMMERILMDDVIPDISDPLAPLWVAVHQAFRVVADYFDIPHDLAGKWC